MNPTLNAVLSHFVGELAVLLLTPLRIRFAASVSLATIAIGCSMTPKSSGLEAPKIVAQPSSEQTSTSPGSADFSSKKNLTNPVKTHLACALWHQQEGRQLDARNSYNKVLEKDPKNTDALIGLARLDMELNRMSDAESRLLKAQKLSPKNPQVAAAFGQYYAAQKDWPHATECLQSAHTLAPYEKAYTFQLGVIQAMSGDSTSALISLTEAGGAADAHYNLAVILQDQGQIAGVEEHLKKALALKPQLPQADKLLAAVRQTRERNQKNVTQSASINNGVTNSNSEVTNVNYLVPSEVRRPE